MLYCPGAEFKRLLHVLHKECSYGIQDELRLLPVGSVEDVTNVSQPQETT
jgi:hypothetical protein